MSTTKFPVLFLTHGAGPMMFVETIPFPVLGEVDKHSPAAKWYRALLKNLALPAPIKAILIISAHWETANDVHINSQEHHTKLETDYSGLGLPPSITHIKHSPPGPVIIEYSPPGDVNLAKRIHTLLQDAGISAKLDDVQNIDVGAFVPLKLIDPEAKIPVVQMSLLKSLSPAEHLAVGKALAPLRNEQVLIIGSGSTCHGFEATQEHTDSFVDKLMKVVTEYNEHDREQALLNWEEVLPFARMNHPRQEHFIPLHIAVGAAGSDRGKWMNPEVIKTQACFRFGD